MEVEKGVIRSCHNIEEQTRGESRGGVEGVATPSLRIFFFGYLLDSS